MVYWHVGVRGSEGNNKHGPRQPNAPHHFVVPSRSSRALRFKVSVEQASKKSFKSYKYNAVAASSIKAAHLSHWSAISAAMHSAPHSDELLHNLGLRTYAKERHYRQRHRSCALVRIVMARERCPYNTTISKSRRHSPRSCYDRWRCDCSLPRSF